MRVREPDWFSDDDWARFLAAVEEMSDEEAAAYATAALERRDRARAEGNQPLAILLDEVLHVLGERHRRRMEWVREMREAMAPPPPVCRPLTAEELADIDDDLEQDPDVAAAEAAVVAAVARLQHARTLAAVRAEFEEEAEEL